jgi:PEP-CTERM motif
MRMHRCAELADYARRVDSFTRERRQPGQRAVTRAYPKLARLLFGLVCVAFFVFSEASAARAGSIDYVFLADRNFGTMNLQTGAFTLIGAAGAYYQDMASQSGGPLYTADLSTRLLTINTSTGGISSIIGTLGSDIGGLRFDESGTLFGFSHTDLYTVNAANAAVAHIGAFGIISGFYYDGAFNGDTMYLQETNGPGGTSNLYTVNTSTGAASLVGNIGFAVSALDFENGTLYGFTVGAQIITIDTATATGTFLVNQNSVRVVSAAEATVPEPGSLCLLGLGLGGCAAYHWRDQKRWQTRRKRGADSSGLGVDTMA